MNELIKAGQMSASTTSREDKLLIDCIDYLKGELSAGVADDIRVIDSRGLVFVICLFNGKNTTDLRNKFAFKRRDLFLKNSYTEDEWDLSELYSFRFCSSEEEWEYIYGEVHERRSITTY